MPCRCLKLSLIIIIIDEDIYVMIPNDRYISQLLEVKMLIYVIVDDPYQYQKLDQLIIVYQFQYKYIPII